MAQGFKDIQRNVTHENPGYETIFEKISAATSGEPKSWMWYRNAVRKEALKFQETPKKYIRDEIQDRLGPEEEQDANQIRRYPVSGHMYLFEYDAKFKTKLPYYDSFPLVYVTKATKSEFWGMNLHYMSPKKRAWVVKRLMDGRIDAPRSCFHKYLTAHVSGYLLDLAAVEWASAILLPIESFVRNVKGKPGQIDYIKELVWEETQEKFYDKYKQRRIIRGYGKTSDKEMVK